MKWKHGNERPTFAFPIVFSPLGCSGMSAADSNRAAGSTADSQAASCVPGRSSARASRPTRSWLRSTRSRLRPTRSWPPLGNVNGGSSSATSGEDSLWFWCSRSPCSAWSSSDIAERSFTRSWSHASFSTQSVHPTPRAASCSLSCLTCKTPRGQRQRAVIGVAFVLKFDTITQPPRPRTERPLTSSDARMASGAVAAASATGGAPEPPAAAGMRVWLKRDSAEAAAAAARRDAGTNGTDASSRARWAGRWAGRWTGCWAAWRRRSARATSRGSAAAAGDGGTAAGAASSESSGRTGTLIRLGISRCSAAMRYWDRSTQSA